jgi:transcription factor 1
MLIWLVDDERVVALPRHMAMRKKASIEAEISCGKIEELASSTRPKGLFRREDDLEIDSTIKVLERMKEAGMQTPKGRKSDIQLHIEGGSDDATTSVREGDDRQGNLVFRELAVLEEKYAAGKFKQYSDVLRPEQTTKSKKPYAKFEFTPEYDRLMKLRYRVASKANRVNVVSEFVSRNEEIMDMQKELWGGSGPEHEARCEEVMRRIQEFKDDIENIPGPETRVNVLTYLDNQRLLKQETPALLYDRRQFEPLKVQPRDFFPRTELALLDFQPQVLWPVLREDFPASYDVFEYIITVLFSHPGHSVLTGLKSLWPGAYEWIVPECPSLKNPFKGGDMDLTRLTVRCVTHEMLREIMEAWMRWPWKPSRMELLGKHTSYMGSEDNEPMGGDGEALP